MKREAELKAAAMKAVLRLCPSFYIFQVATAGWPDRGIAGAGRVTFWEFKHATPDFDSPGNQELCCMRLAEHAHCRYVIWMQTRFGASSTLIVHPKHVHDRTLIYESHAIGFNHEWFARQVQRAHAV